MRDSFYHRWTSVFDPTKHGRSELREVRRLISVHRVIETDEQLICDTLELHAENEKSSAAMFDRMQRTYDAKLVLIVERRAGVLIRL